MQRRPEVRFRAALSFSRSSGTVVRSLYLRTAIAPGLRGRRGPSGLRRQIGHACRAPPPVAHGTPASGSGGRCPAAGRVPRCSAANSCVPQQAHADAAAAVLCSGTIRLRAGDDCARPRDRARQGKARHGRRAGGGRVRQDPGREKPAGPGAQPFASAASRAAARRPASPASRTVLMRAVEPAVTDTALRGTPA